MSRSFDLVTVGASTQDVFLQSRSFQRVHDSCAPDGFDALIPFGAKLAVDDLFFASGGGGTNVAVTAARFGLHTACIGCIGADAHADDILAELKAEGVSTTLFQRDPELHTGYSVILLDGAGHRAIFTHRGAANHVQSKNIPWKTLKTKAWYLASTGGNLELTHAVARHARLQQQFLAWNPGNEELKHGLHELAPILLSTDVLLVNREEASLLSGRPVRHLSSIVRTLLPLVRDTLLITDGEHGAYVFTQHHSYYSPVLPVDPINTTGAGDGFGSAFVAARLMGKSIEVSFRAAMLNAASVITHMGPKVGILKKFPSSSALSRVTLETC